jgi:hypothetical protein
LSYLSLNIDAVHETVKEKFEEEYEAAQKEMAENLMQLSMKDDPRMQEIETQLQDTTLSYSQYDSLYEIKGDIRTEMKQKLKGRSKYALDSLSKEQLGVPFDSIWNIWNGDILLGITGSYHVQDTFTKYEYTETEDGEFDYQEIQKIRSLRLPYTTMILPMNATKPIENVLKTALKKGAIVETSTAGMYKFIAGKYPVYFGITDDRYVYISNDSLVLEKRVSKVNSNIQNRLFEFSFKADALWNYRENLEEEMPEGIEQVVRQYIGGLSFFMERQDKNTIRSVLSFDINPEDQNALKSISNMINAFYMIEQQKSR